MTDYCFITGDSFEEDSLLWSPSAGQLISHAHQLVFDTFAKGGQGNFYILDSIIKNICDNFYSNFVEAKPINDEDSSK